MTESQSALRKEVVDYMHLVASRNRAGIENKSDSIIKSLERNANPECQGLLLWVQGITSFVHNDYQSAKNHFEKVFEQEPTNPDLQGIAYMGLGLTNRSLGHLDEAVTNLSSAAELITEDGGFYPFLAYCYQMLGDIHAAIEEYSAAITYFHKAFDVSEGENDELAFFRYHMGVGGCYLKMKDYEKSKHHLTRALETNGRPATVTSRIENDLGMLYLETKEYDKAENFLTRSLAVRQANGLEDAACTTMTALAEVYLAQQKVAEVLNLLDNCLVLVDRYNTKWKKLEVLRLLAKANRVDGNFEMASEYYEQYIALYAELRGEQERNILKFKNEQIERQRKEISDKHAQLAATFEEIKRLKVDRKAAVFSWITIIILVIISELFIDPLIDNYAYNNILSLLVKVAIALLFKPIDGRYENILWKRTMKKVE
jgi:tetratricopeptide (TPR) repeat protein